jgi:hypothetical protein
MFSTKIRTGLALFAATFTVALAAGPMAPADAQAMVKSNPTGNSQLDGICKQMADLINYAQSQGDVALVNGDDEGAQAWYDLADEMIRGGTAKGCKFSSAFRHRARADVPTVGPVQTSPEPTGKRPPAKLPVRGLQVGA